MIVTRSRRAESEASEVVETETPVTMEKPKNETPKKSRRKSPKKTKQSPKKTPEKDNNEKKIEKVVDTPEEDISKEKATDPTDIGFEISKEPDSKATLFTKEASKESKANKKKKPEKNALTHLIPGYTAPMKLNTSSLDLYRPKGGLSALQRRAERTDASTKNFVLEASSKHTDAMQNESKGLTNSSYAAAYSSFKRGKKKAPDNTAGKGWFGMKPSEMTAELKTDLAVIRNRSYLDPKKFYKSADKHHEFVQLGTVIEGAAEYYSSRLTKKERRSNFTDEIMADPDSSNWTKRKFKQMSQEKDLQARQRKRKISKQKRVFM